MPISFENAFSIHDDALLLRSRRSSILAANIANSDTPNYKARDMDFNSMLKSAQNKSSFSMTMTNTNSRHIQTNADQSHSDVKYRNPLHASLDGNTVDVHVEQARFSENAVKYQTSYTFLNGAIKGLMLALRGE